jgi:hypothetical protein
MSTLIAETPRTAAAADNTAAATTTPAERLRTTMAAARVSFTWLGIRRTLSAEQKAQAADTFGAEGSYLSAGKKLLDTSHPAMKAVTAVRGRIVSLWRAVSLPYPEPGIRLIRQDRIDEFDTKMRELREELAEAVASLDRHYHELKTAARQRLGSLYNPEDYPASLRGLFHVEWDFPSIEPPEYLQQLNPRLYEEECRRVQERFGEAVRLAEEAFCAELARLVSHLTERLTGTEDGRPKIFRDSAVGNLSEFFERFQELSVRSSAELDNLVAECRRLVRGVRPQQLRDNGGLRQHVAAELSRVQGALDELLVDRPRRNILRRPR